MAFIGVHFLFFRFTLESNEAPDLAQALTYVQLGIVCSRFAGSDQTYFLILGSNLYHLNLKIATNIWRCKYNLV